MGVEQHEIRFGSVQVAQDGKAVRLTQNSGINDHVLHLVLYTNHAVELQLFSFGSLPSIISGEMSGENGHTWLIGLYECAVANKIKL